MWNAQPDEDVVEYYRQRASVGLIVSEDIHPSFTGQGFLRQSGLVTEEQSAADLNTALEWIAGVVRSADVISLNTTANDCEITKLARPQHNRKLNQWLCFQIIAPMAIRLHDNEMLLGGLNVNQRH